MLKQKNSERKILRWYQKNYLIDYKRQFRIILTLAGVALFFTALMCFISYAWILHLQPLFTQTIMGPSKPEESYKIIADILLYRLIGVMTVMYFFFVLTGIVLTHRLTGPIWKLQRDLKRFLNEEEIESIGFRRGDEFRDLPDLINKLINGYKTPQPKN